MTEEEGEYQKAEKTYESGTGGWWGRFRQKRGQKRAEAKEQREIARQHSEVARITREGRERKAKYIEEKTYNKTYAKQSFEMAKERGEKRAIADLKPKPKPSLLDAFTGGFSTKARKTTIGGMFKGNSKGKKKKDFGMPNLNFNMWK